ncbi:MAG: hypothetical protein WBG36_09360 [Ornithinimicrobium sp.]
MSGDLIIEGPPEELEALRKLLETEFGPDAAVQQITSSQSGQLREPLTIALIVALGGPVLTTTVAGVIRRYMTHRERMKELDGKQREAEMRHEIRLALVGPDDHEQPVTLEALESS